MILYATVGLPASGKTTWARTLLTQATRGAVVRVNRDDLRRMMLPSTYREPVRHVEEIISEVQRAMLETALRCGLTVVVDDTNLRPAYLDRLAGIATAEGAAFVVVDFTRVRLETCLTCDQYRAEVERVGPEVIHHMAALLPVIREHMAARYTFA